MNTTKRDKSSSLLYLVENIRVQRSEGVGGVVNSTHGGNGGERTNESNLKLESRGRFAGTPSNQKPL